MLICCAPPTNFRSCAPCSVSVNRISPTPLEMYHLCQEQNSEMRTHQRAHSERMSGVLRVKRNIKEQAQARDEAQKTRTRSTRTQGTKHGHRDSLAAH